MSGPMQAIFQDTAPAQTSFWVMPAVYTIKLSANGKSYTQPLMVKMDPRVKTPVSALTQQFTLSKQCYDDIVASAKVLEEIRAARAKNAELEPKLTALAGSTGGGRGGGGRRGPFAAGPHTLPSGSAGLNTMLGLI